jgi:YD repeat-containing protein
MNMSYDLAQRLVTAVQSSTTITFTFDDNGNQTTENRAVVVTGYVYDPENRLKKQTEPDGSVTTMTYDGDGLRRSKAEDGTGIGPTDDPAHREF